MAAWVCDQQRGGCTAVYSVDAPACPECGHTAAYEQGDEQQRDARTDQERNPPSAGISSSASSPKPANSPAPNTPPHPQPARTTGSPSKPDPTGNSAAATTATAGPGTGGDSP